PKKENVVSGKQRPASQRAVLAIGLAHEEPCRQRNAKRAQTKNDASTGEDAEELLQGHQQDIHRQVRIGTKRDCVVFRKSITWIVDVSQDEDSRQVIWIIK